MIKSQGYFMELECSDCGTRETVVAEGKQGAIREARTAGWSLSQSTHACWCPNCKSAHQYVNKMKRAGRACS